MQKKIERREMEDCPRKVLLWAWTEKGFGGFNYTGEKVGAADKINETGDGTGCGEACLA
jgi:hypothetical protein